MSATAITATTTQESTTLSRVVRKIKCAAMVNGLAKSWQSWASDHSDKQDTIPSGWMPDSVITEEENQELSKVKLAMTPHAVTVDTERQANNPCSGSSSIKTVAVTKSGNGPRLAECSNDWVSTMKERINSNKMAPSEDSKPFLGKESPTRRRLSGQRVGCIGGGESLVKAPGQTGREERKLGSRSSSLDTEDSGIGEETALSDQSDHGEAEPKKTSARPKIKVATMSDIKNKWQRWSEDHMENQKLNPFSEDFDFEHSMATRLKKGDTGYGRPKDGSKTALRGERAHKHIHKEMEEMCFIIRDMGQMDKQGRIFVTFGRLFDRYVKISDKVVGILLRCRKHKMLDFEGEMLWKGQDDHIIITLLD